MTIKVMHRLTLQESLNSGMSSLMTDNDKDVAQAARCVHETYKCTNVRLAGSNVGYCSASSNNNAAQAMVLGCAAADWEARDRTRESSESDFTFSLEELDRQVLKGVRGAQAWMVCFW
jgi:serine/threonine-protein phosphatase 4 regulatory subunit 4